MKYITLIIGLLVVGCGKQEQTDTNESTPTTTEKPDKELTPEQKQKALRDSAVGTYEGKNVGDTLVFLDNGVLEVYNDGEKRKEGKWDRALRQQQQPDTRQYQLSYDVGGRRKTWPQTGCISRFWKKGPAAVEPLSNVDKSTGSSRQAILRQQRNHSGNHGLIRQCIRNPSYKD